jgi:glucose/arabinose dehydrogenase
MRLLARLFTAVFACAIFISTGLAAPLPYVTEPAFSGLRLNQPLAIVSPPGDAHRLFILEKPGRILVVDVTAARPAARVFLDLTERVGNDDVEQGVLALAFHPDWRRNRQLYVWYTSCHTRGFTTVREDRLSRFLISAQNADAADAASEEQMIAQPDRAPNHNGGELLFGSDGYLYLSLGDEGGANDQFQNSQRLDKNFFSGILRLDVDRRPGSLPPNPHPAVFPGIYAVPPDNPFVSATSFNGAPVDPARVHTEFWAVGLRNSWRMSFDPATGWLWCGDVGQDLHEEIDLIVRGGNYGWNFREGAFPFRRNPPAAAKFIEPIWDYPHTPAEPKKCITGGLVYHGQRCADLDGKYLFADYVTGEIWALTPDGNKPVGPSRVQQIAEASGIVSFARDPRNGDVLLADIAGGRILRLVRNPAAK